MKTFLTSLLVLLCIAVNAQQSIDLLTISQNFNTPSNFKYSGGNSKAVELNTLVNLKIPVPVSEKLLWYSDITYTINELQVKANEQIPRTVYRLNGLVFQTGLILKLNQTTSLQTIIAPRLMGESLNFNKETTQLGGIVMLERTYSSKLTLRYGVLYNGDKFGPLFVPLIYTNWQPFEGWFINGLWPIYGKIGKQVNERLQIGVSEFGLVTSYILNKTNINTYIERSSVDLALFTRYKTYKNWHLEGRIGYSLSRGYEQYSVADKLNAKLSIVNFEGMPRQLLNGTIASAPFINFRLVYNLPIE